MWYMKIQLWELCGKMMVLERFIRCLKWVQMLQVETVEEKLLHLPVGVFDELFWCCGVFEVRHFEMRSFAICVLIFE